MGAFDGLIQKVSQHTDVEKTAHSVALALQEAVARRHDFSLTEPLPIVKDDNPNFNLMYNLRFINPEKTPIIAETRSSMVSILEGPHYWFLSDKAVKFHRDLAYEGYYDNQRES